VTKTVAINVEEPAGVALARKLADAEDVSGQDLLDLEELLRSDVDSRTLDMSRALAGFRYSDAVWHIIRYSSTDVSRDRQWSKAKINLAHLITATAPRIQLESCWTKTQLKERGWTETAITEFLGQPDTNSPNRMSRGAAPICLYDTVRVEEVEQSEEYQIWAAKSAVRKARSKASAERSRERLLESLESWQPSFPVGDNTTLDDVIAAACDSYNERLLLFPRGRDDERSDASPRSDEKFLRRITVNYLRHNVSDYEAMLKSLHGKVGINDAVDLVRERVYDAIADRFPDLAGECQVQMHDRAMRA